MMFGMEERGESSKHARSYWPYSGFESTYTRFTHGWYKENLECGTVWETNEKTETSQSHSIWEGLFKIIKNHQNWRYQVMFKIYHF